MADRLLLNKADTVDDATLVGLEKTLRELNGVAALQRTQYSRVRRQGFSQGEDSRDG